MAHVDVEERNLLLEDPLLLDGLPGAGLIGKLVADHVVAQFDMEYYAGVYCEGVRPVAAYRAGATSIRPPVQIYADQRRDLLALVSDVPVSASDAPAFADCITGFFAEHSVTPVYLSGLSESGTGGEYDAADGEDAASDEDATDARQLYGVATGDGGTLLERADLPAPDHDGIVSGPTGALLHRATEVGLDAVGLLVDSGESLPDVDAARLVIEQGVEPITGVDVDTGPFAERTVELSPITQSFLDSMRDGDGSSRAEPTPTFH